jgi:hypothetical protein
MREDPLENVMDVGQEWRKSNNVSCYGRGLQTTNSRCHHYLLAPFILYCSCPRMVVYLPLKNKTAK